MLQQQKKAVFNQSAPLCTSTADVNRPFPTECCEPKYKMEVTQMEMEVNMNMQLVVSICSDSPTIIGCAHSCAEKSLIPDEATPERCAGIT